MRQLSAWLILIGTVQALDLFEIKKTYSEIKACIGDEFDDPFSEICLSESVICDYLHQSEWCTKAGECKEIDSGCLANASSPDAVATIFKTLASAMSKKVNKARPTETTTTAATTTTTTAKPLTITKSRHSRIRIRTTTAPPERKSTPHGIRRKDPENGTSITPPSSTTVVASADTDPLCCFWASLLECDKNPYWMKPNCPTSCGTVGADIPIVHTLPSNVPQMCRDTQQALLISNAGNAGRNNTVNANTVPSASPNVTTNVSNGTTANRTCQDTDTLCPYWARLGECPKNKKWMLPNCPVSCKTCGATVDNLPNIPELRAIPGVRSIFDPFPLNSPLARARNSVAHASQSSVSASQVQMPLPLSTGLRQRPPVSTVCNDRHILCDFWRQRDQCNLNAAYMELLCMKSCSLC